jgi:hypothetical protein
MELPRSDVPRDRLSSSSSRSTAGVHTRNRAFGATHSLTASRNDRGPCSVALIARRARQHRSDASIGNQAVAVSDCDDGAMFVLNLGAMPELGESTGSERPVVAQADAKTIVAMIFFMFLTSAVP